MSPADSSRLTRLRLDPPAYYDNVNSNPILLLLRLLHEISHLMRAFTVLPKKVCRTGSSSSLASALALSCSSPSQMRSIWCTIRGPSTSVASGFVVTPTARHRFGSPKHSVAKISALHRYPRPLPLYYPDFTDSSCFRPTELCSYILHAASRPGQATVLISSSSDASCVVWDISRLGADVSSTMDGEDGEGDSLDADAEAKVDELGDEYAHDAGRGRDGNVDWDIQGICCDFTALSSPANLGGILLITHHHGHSTAWLP
ncbi:hypothetical protein C8R47DRAFT_1189734 [Mycena vitilis]|nr:hypothetical protein C8R47DRAFT_1189734 [Mycena vitilis]